MSCVVIRDLTNNNVDEILTAKANKNSLDVSGKTSSVLFIIKIEVRTMWQSSHLLGNY